MTKHLRYRYVHPNDPDCPVRQLAPTSIEFDELEIFDNVLAYDVTVEFETDEGMWFVDEIYIGKEKARLNKGHPLFALITTALSSKHDDYITDKCAAEAEDE